MNFSVCFCIVWAVSEQRIHTRKKWIRRKPNVGINEEKRSNTVRRILLFCLIFFFFFFSFVSVTTKLYLNFWTLDHLAATLNEYAVVKFSNWTECREKIISNYIEINKFNSMHQKYFCHIFVNFISEERTLKFEYN